MTESAHKRERARRETRRRFEQWANNPDCHANVVSAVHNVKMSAVARRENPDVAMSGQSVFALERGNNFEAGLMENGAERLLVALERASVIASGRASFLDHRTVANGGGIASLDEAVAAGHRFLTDLANGSGFTGAVSSLTVRIPRGIMLPEATLIIDVLAVRQIQGRPVIEVGEIKTYADQGGHTNRGNLSAARAQMGLYTHALEITLESLDIAENLTVSEEGFLVLTYPGSNQPSVRSGEDLRYQRERAKRGFDMMEASALVLSDQYGSGDDDDPESLLSLVLEADTAYNDSCLSFCDRAEACYRRAVDEGQGIVLGHDVHRFLNGTSLHRLDELMSGARPANIAEIELLDRLKQQLPVLP